MVETALAVYETETNPQSVVTKGQATANACRAIVMQCSMQLQGKRYIKAEGWQALAASCGYSPRIGIVEELNNGDIRAVCDLVRLSDGEIVASAEGYLGMDEGMWAKRPRYARRAMAQTRATSRACRSALAWIVPLLDAGLETTPAEEIPHAEIETRSMPVQVSAPRVEVPEAGMVRTVSEQSIQKIVGLISRAKNAGVISDAEVFRNEMRKTYGVKSAKELTEQQADEVLDSLQSMLAERAAIAEAN
jgi:hypothetical protein